MKDSQRVLVLAVALALMAVGLLSCASLLQGEPQAGDAPILYTVQPGDTLRGIATCLGQSDVDWRAIVSVIEDENPRETGRGIQAGDVLYLPLEITGGDICEKVSP